MKITLLSVSAVRKPAKTVKTAVRAPNRGAPKKAIKSPTSVPKAKKKVKIPNSVQYLADKGKMRIRFAEPGRYILQGAKGTVVVMRVKQEMKYTPSVATKAFTATASDTELLQYIGAGDYAEPINLLLAEAAAKAPGAKNKAAGAKMGRKQRASNMLAPGWWVFVKPKVGKIRKEYVGPRMSARRLLGIVQGESTAKTTKIKTGKNSADLPELSPRALKALNDLNLEQHASLQKQVDKKKLDNFDLSLIELAIKKVLGRTAPINGANAKKVFELIKKHKAKPSQSTKGYRKNVTTKTTKSKKASSKKSK